MHGREQVKIGAVFVKCVVFNTSCVANFPSETISIKLTEENKARTDTEYSKNSKHYEAEKLRVAGEHASIIHFLSTTVDGIEGTAAAPLIRAKKYDQILESIRSSYGCIQSPKACNDLQVELGMITLGDDETVNQFVQRIRNLVANIQVISESLENKNPRLTFSEAYEGSTYTEEKWKLHFASSTPYTGHLALLQTQASCLRLQCSSPQG